MAIGNVPGDLVASAVLDTLTLGVEPGSIGVSVSSVVADGPSAVRVTLSAPADIAGTIAIAEVDSGAAPFIATCEPTGALNEWRISWAPVGGGGVSSVSASSPLFATTIGGAVALTFLAGTAAGQVLTWNGTKWVAVAPAPSVPWVQNVALGGFHNNASPLTIGGLYVDAPRTLAATCEAQFVGVAPYRVALSLVDSTGAVAAQWDTGTAGFAANRVVQPLGAPVALPAGWYTWTLAQFIGAGATVAAGVYLTE